MPVVIYSANLKTDREKLFACYSLLEQMRLEHNKVVGIAKKNPNKYLKTGKFRTYAHESKAKLKKLLAEQNRLKESIRWANYTLEQWKAVGKLDLEEQAVIYQTLFGNRMQEKVKTTKATSPVLDELKALNLDDMPEVLGADPTEDFTTYTEVDEGSDVTKTADRITFTAVESRSDTFHVHYDKSANHFDGDFEHLEKVYISAIAISCLVFSWVLANMVGDLKDMVDASEDALCSLGYRYSGGYKLFLKELDGGTFYDDTYESYSLSTVYYLELERDEAVGAQGTIYAYICTTDYWDDGGDQVDTLTVALHTSKKDFRYIYGLAGYDDATGTGYTATGYVELLDLQEGGVNYPISTSSNLSLSPSLSRSLALDRGISSNLSLAASVSRIYGRIRTTSSNLSLAASVSRTLAIVRDTSSNLSLAVSLAKIWGRTITTSANLSLTTTVGRTVAWARATTSNLSLATSIVATTVKDYLITITANLSLATNVAKSWGHTIATSTNLSLVVTVGRAVTFARVTASNLSLNAIVTRALVLARTKIALLGLKITGIRTTDYWVSPTGHYDQWSAWSEEGRAYDEDTGTWAYKSTTLDADTWSPFLELTHAAINCNKIRLFGRDTVISYIVDIDVYDGTWHHVYEGAITKNAWNEKSIGSTLSVTKARIRNLRADGGWGVPYCSISEFDFWKIGAGLHFDRLYTALLGLKPTATRVVAYTRTIASNLSLASTIAKSWSRTITTSSSLSLAASISRAVAYARASSSNLSLTAAVSRIRGWTVATSSALNLTTAISTLKSFVRATASNLSLTSTISRVLTLTRSKTALLGLLATGLKGAIHYIEEGIAYLGLVATATRTVVYTRIQTALLGLKATASKIQRLIESMFLTVRFYARRLITKF